MSSDILHFGKFRILTKTTEETLDLITELQLNIEIEHYPNYISFYSNSEDYDVFQVKNQYILVRYLEQYKQVDDPYFTKVIDEGNDEYFFLASFYNGGTCLQEILEYELNKLK